MIIINNFWYFEITRLVYSSSNLGDLTVHYSYAFIVCFVLDCDDVLCHIQICFQNFKISSAMHTIYLLEK